MKKIKQYIQIVLMLLFFNSSQTYSETKAPVKAHFGLGFQKLAKSKGVTCYLSWPGLEDKGFLA